MSEPIVNTAMIAVDQNYKSSVVSYRGYLLIEEPSYLGLHPTVHYILDAFKAATPQSPPPPGLYVLEYDLLTKSNNVHKYIKALSVKRFNPAALPDEEFRQFIDSNFKLYKKELN